MLRDRSSHGTLLNGVAIESGQPVPIRDGDRIGVGPFVLGVGERLPSATLMLSDDGARRHSTISVTGRDLDPRPVPASRLRMLFESAGEMRRAASKGVFHRNTVSRKISRLSHRVKAIAEA